MSSHETDRSTPGVTTAGGIDIACEVERVDASSAIEHLIDLLDAQRGLLLASSYEVPGRYTRWDLGFTNPPLVVTARDRDVEIRALNERGRVLLPALQEAVRSSDAVRSVEATPDTVVAQLERPAGRFPEEQRSRQPSVFSILRAIHELFESPDEPHLGLYGAFGYDLAFQFEPLSLRHERSEDQRDLVLYLPDEILVVDHQREDATIRRYDFAVGDRRTDGLARDGASSPFVAREGAEASADHAPGEYADVVRRARESFACGDLFEVVPSQVLFEPCNAPPSELFRRLRDRNPSPYGFLINLGAEEYLVGASPEMYTRVTRVRDAADDDDWLRIETCPIAGTIARGNDPLGDARQIQTLLSSLKEESELTMCTDVDRNDKSRVCVPGSVRVLARRQIELYSRLIHTVDHVEGRLRPEFDALDAFLAHTWAVTVTGAPKTWAMKFIEENERSPRRWYGGAVGFLGFNGEMNTGLTLRTVRVARGLAEVRVGATLLFDSDPDDEEAETRLKAAAFLDALRHPDGDPARAGRTRPRCGVGRRILLVDCEDSFVHTLGNYFRQTGAEVETLRVSSFLEQAQAELDRLDPDLVVLSPGPGRPDDFGMREVLDVLTRDGRPLFGVCLGLQSLAEYYGGTLDQLDVPVHGKPSAVKVLGGRLFRGFPAEFQAGRYHSLYARKDAVPDVLEVTAVSSDGIVMALEHRDRPIAAVQFHPESILTFDDELGMRLIENVVGDLPERI